MQMRKLGSSGLTIAPLVFGGNVFGWTADKSASFDLLDRFIEASFNAIDTANSYQSWIPGNIGMSETIIGEWMATRRKRDDVVLITKVGSDIGQGKKDLSAAHIAAAAEESLRRLQTDRIDLYFSHWHDPSADYAETLGAYDRLIRHGKVHAIGASNHNAAQVREALAVARENNLPRYSALQPEYNLYDRLNFENDLRDLAISENLGVITYYSLASGFLSGKYRGQKDLKQSVRGGGIERYLNPRGMRILDALEDVATKHRSSPAETALAWIMAQPGVTAPIASATSLDQLESLIKSAALQLNADDLAELDRASAE